MLSNENSVQGNTKSNAQNIQNAKTDFAIHLENVSYTYDNHSVTSALKDVNLSIGYGKMLAILGPNGGGKSTLVKLAMGLLPIENSTGKVLIDGKSPTDVIVGYVPQNVYINNNFPITIGEVCMMGASFNRNAHGNRPSHSEIKAKREQVDTLMKKLNIEKSFNKRINEVSGGQLQKAFIIRALMCESKVIFMDEPFSNLDKASIMSIYELLKEMIAIGRTIAVVSHDVSTIHEYASIVAYVNHSVQVEAVVAGKKLNLDEHIHHMYCNDDISNIYAVGTHHHNCQIKETNTSNNDKDDNSKKGV